MEWWSLRIVQGFRTQTTNWIFFLSRWSWSDECWFFRQIFRGSYTCSSDYNMYDGGVYIHSAVARTFFCTKRVHNHICTLLMRVTYTHGSSVCKKVCCMHMSLISISPSPFSCLTHPCWSRTVTSRLLPATTSLTIPSTRSCSTYLSQKRRTHATPHEHRGVWLPGQIRSQHRLWAQKVRREYFHGWWHDAHQRSGPQYLRHLENHEREHQPIRCSHSVRILCFARFSWWFCSSNRESKESMQSGNRCQTEREREERAGFVISAAESMSKKSQRNGICVSLKSLRKFFSDGWDLQEHLQRRTQQAIPAENSDQRKLCLNEYEMEIQNSERRNSEYALIESQRELESQRRQLLEANQSKLNVRNTFV